jgi:hypothetical protein
MTGGSPRAGGSRLTTTSGSWCDRGRPAGPARPSAGVGHPAIATLLPELPLLPTIRWLLGLSLSAGPLAAQTTTALARPDAEWKEPFTRVRSVREVSPGRVLVSDTQDKVVSLVDFTRGTAAKVGREGQGPGEYGLPGDLYVVSVGQVWLADIMARRFLTIDGDGKTGKTVSMPGGAGPGGLLFGDPSGQSDGAGRLYFRGPSFRFGSGGPTVLDSMPIVRWDRVSPKVDTVAWTRAAKNSAQVSGSGNRSQVMFGVAKVFTAEEQWGVAADGSVVRVIPAPFQLVWYSPNGKVLAGPVQSYTPIKVTAADRKEVIAARKKEKPMMVSLGGNGRAAPPPNITLPDPEFEDAKPPFSGPGSVQVTPEGEVWVLRTRPASDRIPSYDIFDRSGRVVRRVTLNPKSRVMSFGPGTVYVIRVDDEDLEYVQRFKR